MASKVEAALKKASSEEFRSFILQNAEAISAIGVSDENELRRFHHISQFVPALIKRAIGMETDKLNAAVSEFVFHKYPRLNSVDELKGIVIEALAEQESIKKAYVNMMYEVDPIPTYNTYKWVQTANDIYMKSRVWGQPTQNIIPEATKGWSEMETNKFRDWLRFYEEGGHTAYKMAQALPKNFTTENGLSIPFMNSNNNDIRIAPIPGLLESDEAESERLQKEVASKNLNEQEARNKIRSSIVGRINSAKRLLSTDIGRKFVGNEYPKLLTSLLALEKDILSLNSDLMVHDLVKRAENSLRFTGCSKAASLISKIAEDPSTEGDGNVEDKIRDALQKATPAPKKMLTVDELKKKVQEQENESSEDTAAPVPPADQSANPPPAGDASGSAINAPPAPPAPPPPATASYGPAWAMHKTAELGRLEKVAEYIGELALTAKKIIRTAQVAPAKPAKAGFFPEDSLDKAFENITIQDVTRRLQALSKIFKNREIARQLAIIDLMLDKLGIAGLFPQLAEATKSALESNQYSSIRIEEILNKLMSVMDDSGNVNINITNKEEKSFVDKEMEQALQQADIMAQPGPVAAPSPATTPIPAGPPPVAPRPVNPPVPPPIPPGI